MTPDPRIDWLRVTFWGALLLATCAVATAVGWLIERFIARYGPWIMAHADAIAAVVLTVCAVLLMVLAVAERAKKDNPTW